HHVPGLPGVGEVENDDQNGDEVIVGQPGCRQQRSQQHRQRYQAAARNALDQPADHVSRFPRMPCGRNRSTSTSRPNENMLLAEGGKNGRPSPAPTQTSPPPNGARAMEPSPPVITMMKASSV